MLDDDDAKIGDGCSPATAIAKAFESSFLYSNRVQNDRETKEKRDNPGYDVKDPESSQIVFSVVAVSSNIATSTKNISPAN